MPADLDRRLNAALTDLFPRSVEQTRWALDPLEHVDAGHVWLLDLETRRPTRLIPYDHEREIAAAWIDLEQLADTRRLFFRNTHGEKSRQMGWTWFTAYLCLWALSYHDVRGLMIHMNGKEVDNGGRASTPESFFGKIRFMAQHRPDDGTDAFADYAPPILFRGQPESEIRRGDRAYLVGETANPNPGRGGTYDFVVVDEAARIPWGRSVQAAIAPTCPSGRLYVSTPKGEDELFWGIRYPRQTDGYQYLRHHWSIHPVYSVGVHVAAVPPDRDEPGRASLQPTPKAEQAARACRLCAGTISGKPWRRDRPESHRFPGKLSSPWFERAHPDLSDEQVAAELEIDYAGSLSGRVYSEFDENVHVLAHIDYDPKIQFEFSFDYGVASPTSVGIWQDAPDSLRLIGEFEEAGLAPDQVAVGVRAVQWRLGVPPEYADAKWTSRSLSVGDPAGEAKQAATARSLTSDYAAAGFSIVSQPTTSVAQTINSVKRMLRGIPKPIRISGDTCPKAISHLKGNRWPTDRDGRLRPGATQPLNDEHNHFWRGASYFITWKYPAPPVDEALHSATANLYPLITGRIDETVGYAMDF
jgi:hypothetical protein